MKHISIVTYPILVIKKKKKTFLKKKVIKKMDTKHTLQTLRRC